MKSFIKHPPIFKLLITTLGCGMTALVLLWASNHYVDTVAKDHLTTISDAPEADAVMILGAFVYQNGQPSSILKDRLNNGYQLYHSGKVKKILVSGDHGTKDYDEVNTMKNYLVSKGVPEEDIFLDHAGFNTYDSMYRAKEIFQIHTLLISTQDFHIQRSVYIARSLGIDAYGVPVNDQYVYKRNYYQLREAFAKAKAVIDTDITKRPPMYLGNPIPITGSGLATKG